MKITGAVLEEIGRERPYAETQPISISEVELGEPGPTELLVRMEAAGLVRRTRHPEDERRVVIELTESGKILRNQAVYVPETLARGRKSEGIDELRDSVRRLVELLAEQTGSKR